MRKHSLTKQFICIFLSFILTICLTVIALFSSIKIGFIGMNAFSKALSDSDYYQRRFDTFLENLENEALISGLSETLFHSAFSLNEFQSNCNDYFQSITNHTRYDFDDTKGGAEMKAMISERIHNYVAEHNLEVDGNIEEIITSFSSSICEFYEEALRFPFFENLSNLYQTFDKLILIILPIMAALAVFIIVFLYRLNKKKRNRAFRYIAYAFLSSAISVLVLPIASYATNFYKKVYLTEEFLYRAFVCYFENGIDIFTMIGGICAVIGILCIITSISLKRKLVKEEKAHRKVHRSYHHHHSEHTDADMNPKTDTSVPMDIDEEIKQNVEFF